jgi:hypothetical protein
MMRWNGWGVGCNDDDKKAAFLPPSFASFQNLNRHQVLFWPLTTSLISSGGWGPRFQAR